MNEDIHIERDENSKIIFVKIGDQVFVETPVPTVEETVEVEPKVAAGPEPAPVQHGPRPAAINNHRSTDAGCWFGGTSWSTK